MPEGVLISQLRCPTCRAAFDLALKEETEDVHQWQSLSTVKIPITPPHLECGGGHRWTVTMLEHDSSGVYVMLGEYIGGGDLEGGPREE